MSFFLGSKKRDHSDKSNDGKDPKKVEESDSLSSLPDEVFSDGLDSPELAKLLVNCLKSILKIFTFHERAKESKTKVTESLDFMSAKFHNLEKKSRKKMKRLIS